MLGVYYYVLSSLPYLDLKSTKEYSLKDFFYNVEVALEKKDFDFLQLLKNGNFYKGNSKTIDSLIEFEQVMKHTLAYVRSEKLNWPRESYVNSPYFSNYYLSIIKNIILKSNPFEIELEFDVLKWQFFNDLEVVHEFDFEKLVIYFLKLMIIIRKNSFEMKLGQRKFDFICENLYLEINQKI